MGSYRDRYEPMCETSEEGERLFTRESIQMTSFDIGERILSLFGYQTLTNVVFRLRVDSHALSAVIDGDELPSAEMLLGIQKLTGASIDWILTGRGRQFLHTEEPMIRPPQTLPPPARPRRKPCEAIYVVEIPTVS
ncbi:MAG: hypothetical protein ABL952_14900 [Pyrinomonadaceae bacterium]